MRPRSFADRLVATLIWDQHMDESYRFSIAALCRLNHLPISQCNAQNNERQS